MTIPSPEHGETHVDDVLVARIRESTGSEHVVSTTLQTDERVIARVTDGIYRQPGSALRELISNAYDADASRVVIKTDAPRFDRMVIEDDGHGMSIEALAHLLLHIGGSAKRSAIGSGLGDTAPNDPSRSPGGRKLIGKIGIGLFSVSQLTRSFQIITKVKGATFRTIATITLKQYADEDIAPGADEQTFESGKVNIWREKAVDIESHGTTIVLTSIRPQARDTLRSKEIWSSIDQLNAATPANDEPKELATIEPPQYHIGRVDESGQVLKGSLHSATSLPWDESDPPEQAFRKLVECVWDEVERANPNPQLDRIFDYYLRMIWQLSLAVPLPYVDGHLFDAPLGSKAEVFRVSNLPKGAADAVPLAPRASVRSPLRLVDGTDLSAFEVFVDSLKLTRPIKFMGLPVSRHALKTPLVFIGKCREEFSRVGRDQSGGALAFEAYLFWTPKVAPTEHQGSLIRIHGSSGTLFDPTFMRYQVSEQTRLRQITCEIFVNEGLDSALNIDRESFNYAHPHSVYITKWLHSALRQLATVQKRLASESREHTRAEGTEAALTDIQTLARDVWANETDDLASAPPEVELTETTAKASSRGDSYVFARSAVAPRSAKARTAKSRAREVVLEEKLKAVAQVLASFGLLDMVSRQKQEKLLRAIYQILDAPEE